MKHQGQTVSETTSMVTRRDVDDMLRWIREVLGLELKRMKAVAVVARCIAAEK